MDPNPADSKSKVSGSKSASLHNSRVIPKGASILEHDYSEMKKLKGQGDLWASYTVKDPKKTEQLKGKYKASRNRDFASQISNLPGPRNTLSRNAESEHKSHVKKYDLKQRDNQAYVCTIDDTYNAHKVDVRAYPTHKKYEEKLDKSTTRKGYALKQFILREKYDFLHP